MLRGWRGVIGTTAVTGIALAGFLAGWGDAPAAQHQPGGLRVHNGWLCHGDDLVWGWIQHNGWWRPGQRPNLCRRSVGDPEGDVRPNRTEDLDQLTDNMLRYGYPGFEHNYGLWFDRRRDAHDTGPRESADVAPPFLEQPWARSQEGRAADGLPRYDLTRFNDWYFGRLEEFASLCDRKGTVLFHCYYMQHALLETQAHYVDFPWRPGNCVQDTGMPDQNPAANAFYDISDPTRRDLHRLYIRRCLRSLGQYRNVVHQVSQEYTGGREFVEFWLDTLMEWQRETGQHILVSLGAPKDVTDAILADPTREPAIDVLDLRCWHINRAGELVAIPGGQEIPGRYIASGSQQSQDSSPQWIYRKTRVYRDAYPDKAIMDAVGQSREQTWASFMAGGSMVVAGQIEYPGQIDPPEYVQPAGVEEILPTYRFIRERLSRELPGMAPADIVLSDADSVWCLAHPDGTLLAYTLLGEPIRLTVPGGDAPLTTRWLDPRTGELLEAGEAEPGSTVEASPPGDGDWALWLSPRG